MLLGRFLTKVVQVPKYNFFQKNSLASSVNVLNETMAGEDFHKVLQTLENFAPLKYAESWDNVGLLVDPMKYSKVQNILLTNDLTEEVVDEALNLQVNLIVTYHPNIFQGLKSLSSKNWKERIVIRCLQNNIGVFSPHTSWDAIQGGVNDWLAKIFPVETSTPILKNLNEPNIGSGRFLTLSKPITCLNAVEKVKTHTGLSHVRLALATRMALDTPIRTVALCAGSGTSVLKGQKADLFLTGEMFHHDILEATQNGTHVILCNHSDSERGYLKEFQAKLESLLNSSVKVIVSKVDKDPLQTL